MPFKKVSITCLVDIGGGKDLAAVTIEDVDKMNVTEIKDYLKNRASKIKKNDGDEVN